MDEAKEVVELRNLAVALHEIKVRVIDCRSPCETGRRLTEARETVLRLAGDIQRLAAEVERLRPREMTLEEAVAVLNEYQFCDCNDWEVYDYDTHTAAECSRGIELIPFEAVAVAEKLLREEEANRA